MNLARALIAAGSLLIFVGLVLLALNRMNLPLGKLPGDIVWRCRGSTVYFPWVSGLVLSVIVSFVLWLFNRR